VAEVDFVPEWVLPNCRRVGGLCPSHPPPPPSTSPEHHRKASLPRDHAIWSALSRGLGSIVSSSFSLSRFMVFSASASGKRAYDPMLFREPSPSRRLRSSLTGRQQESVPRTYRPHQTWSSIRIYIRSFLARSVFLDSWSSALPPVGSEHTTRCYSSVSELVSRGGGLCPSHPPPPPSTSPEHHRKASLPRDHAIWRRCE
jgi:hypothetical protein